MQPRLVEFKRGRKRGSKDKKKRVIGVNDDTHKNIRLGLEGSRQGRRTLGEVLAWLKMFR